MPSAGRAGRLDLLLVEPPGAEVPICTPPLGIGCLAAYLRARDGYRVACLDLSLAVFDRLLTADGLVDLRRLTASLGLETLSTSSSNGRFSLAEVTGARDRLRALQVFTDTGQYTTALVRLQAANEYVLKPLLELCALQARTRGEPAPALAQLLGLAEICRTSPRVVGFSILAPSQLLTSVLLAAALKERRPGTRIVFGGALLPFIPRRELAELLRLSSGPDFIALGEGEVSLSRLLACLLRAGPSLETVPGLCFGEKGRVRFVARTAIRALDALPLPDFSCFDLTRYDTPVPILPILGSRGCRWAQCSFCAYDRNYETYRERTVASVVAEMRAAAERYGCRLFSFADTEISALRLLDICRELEERGCEVSFACMSRPEVPYTDESVVRALRDGGLVHVDFGLESFSSRLLRLMRKGTSAGDLVGVVNTTARCSVDAQYFYIVGFPSQDLEELFGELETIVELSPRMPRITFSPFVPLEFSPLVGDPRLRPLVKIGGARAAPICELPSLAVHDNKLTGSPVSGMEWATAARTWAELLQEVFRTLAAAHDPLSVYAGEHRVVRLGLARLEASSEPEARGIAGSGCETSSASGLRSSAARQVERVEQLRTYLQAFASRRPLLVSFLDTVLRRRIDALAKLGRADHAANPAPGCYRQGGHGSWQKKDEATCAR